MLAAVGEVIAVKGTKILVKVFEEYNKEFLYYQGIQYKGIAIREHLIVRRGFSDIICIVEGEYLDETRAESTDEKISYIRKIEVKPIGYISQKKFTEGIKHLPMIKDSVHLVAESSLRLVYGDTENQSDFTIGTLMREGIAVCLPWLNLFNTHIGIFGNTGSGKSNTLAKLYSVLLSKLDKKNVDSSFILLDFNGEYTGGTQFINESNKTVIQLNPLKENAPKIRIREQEFWDKDVLRILFKATENTQTPFIGRVVAGREKFNERDDSTKKFIEATVKKAFTTSSPRKEMKELLLNVAKSLDCKPLVETLEQIAWHSSQNKFYLPKSATHPKKDIWFNSDDSEYINHFSENFIETVALDCFQELSIRINLQLINDLSQGFVQFEHIQPLLGRIRESSRLLKNLIEVAKGDEESYDKRLLTIISLKLCNDQSLKKVAALLIVRHYYYTHRETVNSPPNKTVHFIIDEAHNILSQQSVREAETWKDYRLELFEEVIKEGRKFGFFLTICSQRPADISPTIMSQIHNFFIHRLVNDRDLQLLENTVSTLDNLSKSMIPHLAKGCCVVTGTSFDIPMIQQIEQLKTEQQPNSGDVNLLELWKIEKKTKSQPKRRIGRRK